MAVNNWQDLDSVLSALQAEDRYRSLRTLQPGIGREVWWNNRSYLNLSSNDYLGLGSRDDLVSVFLSRCTSDDLRLTSSSSRLLTGNTPAYDRLENQLCTWYHKPAALVFNSGYHANLGILSALNEKGCAVFSDKLNHASLIDGMRLSEGEFFRYRHRDYAQLDQLLQKERQRFNRVILVSESVFSMDGDRADIAELVRLRDKYDCLLMVDEAHAVGVCGLTGLGLCEEAGLVSSVDIIVGTFGKALASVGAYGVFEARVRDFLINTMRPLIFTTALPPLNLAWTSFILELIPAMTREREYLAALASGFRQEIQQSGIPVLGNSHIIPLLTGSNQSAVTLSGTLQERGYLVFAIRPPTVPPGGARIRLSLGADITTESLKQLLTPLKEYFVSTES